MDSNSRKRAHTDEHDTPVTKKRALSGANGIPRINGIPAEQEEPTENDNLELFRKEAIFRRMRHYSREHERSQSRIAELERRKTTCEAGLAAMSACWSQLVETIRLIAKPTDIPQVDVTATKIFDLTRHISSEDSEPALVSALQDNMDATEKLVAAFVKLGGEKTSALLHNEAYAKCQTAQSECAALRSEMDLMRNKLKDTESEKEKYHTALLAAETRADRLQSGTVSAMQVRKQDKQEPPDEKEKTEEPERKLSFSPASPSHPSSAINGNSNGHGNANGEFLASVSDGLQDAVNFKEQKIVELERENAVLRDQYTILQLETKTLSAERIQETPHYKALLDRASRLEATVLENKIYIAKIDEEIVQLRTGRKEFEDTVSSAATQSYQDLQGMVAKRDAENTRLREQRDQQNAEITERRHKESIKITSAQEVRTLAESRSERIVVLESELKRHKAQLAANVGNEEVMKFFFGPYVENVAYIEELRSKIATAEARCAALEQSLSIFEDEHPNIVHHMQAEADARQKLADVTAQLKRYQEIYGDASSSSSSTSVTLAPDVQQLADQLKLKEDEIKRLRLLDVQRGQAETSLYAELDKLSAAWEALDRQVKAKVFDLTNMESKLEKISLEKAKSDNKYFAAMRDKEAIEGERKNLARNLEKQSKAMERLMDGEKNLTAQVSAMEKHISGFRKSLETHKDKIRDLDGESVEWKHRAEGEKKKFNEMVSVLQERDRQIDKLRTDLRKLEEEVHKAKKEVERQASKLKIVNTGNGSLKEAEAMSEAEKLMKILKCSTCKMAMRNTVITKCMHTFCKNCVDARIATRQRKCPACNLGFAQSDVQQVYFQ